MFGFTSSIDYCKLVYQYRLFANFWSLKTSVESKVPLPIADVSFSVCPGKNYTSL